MGSGHSCPDLFWSNLAVHINQSIDLQVGLAGLHTILDLQQFYTLGASIPGPVLIEIWPMPGDGTSDY